MEKIIRKLINKLQYDVRKNPDEPRYWATEAMDWRRAVTAIIRPADEDFLLRVEISKLDEDGVVIETRNAASSYIINWKRLSEMLRDTMGPYQYK